ncbi:hypothetical protein V8E55_001306, partial [Tylopilus felleus]
DFNEQFSNGTSFDHLDTIQQEWDDYLVAVLKKRQAEEPSTDDPKGAGSSESKMMKPKLKTHDQLIDLVTNSEGRIWIPDISDAGRGELQGLVRGFLTAHYHEWLVCGKKNASALFKKLPSSQEMLFKKNHIPPDFVFPDDPSHMKVEQARHFLEFVHKCQQNFRMMYSASDIGSTTRTSWPILSGLKMQRTGKI